jgi:hypothetical protein
MDDSLAFIGTMLIVLVIVVALEGLSMEWKLGRLIRIQRAIYHLMMADKTEKAARLKQERMAPPPTAKAPAMPPLPLPRKNAGETPADGPSESTKVYRID